MLLCQNFKTARRVVSDGTVPPSNRPTELPGKDTTCVLASMHACMDGNSWRAEERNKQRKKEKKIEFDTVLHLLVDSVNKATQRCVYFHCMCTASAGFESTTFMSIRSVPIYYMLSPSPWSNQLFQLKASSRRSLSSFPCKL
jgi:hypothetical protein